jgi:type II secretory ATPase GspE/PulE/Tfp pilus assembly ATPase PilB-like protein
LGYVTPEQLSRALQVQAGGRRHTPLGAVLVELKILSEEQLAHALARQMGVPVWDLEAAPPDPALKELVPSVLAQSCRLVPQANENGWLRCVATGPVAPAELAKLEFIVNCPVRLAVATEGAVARQLRELYGVTVEGVIAGLRSGGDQDNGDQEVFIHELRELVEEPTLVNLVNVIISGAITERASDIHIEPFENELKVKYRIDGVLQEMPPPPKHLQAAIVSRIKIMAGLDIAERYLPQDGQIRVGTAEARVDIRVSTIPTVYGESVVLRLLNKDESLLKLTQLGMNDATRRRFEHLLGRTYGIILVCGPTGSGKTTTLYSALLKIYTPEKKIITIEDPVEYQIHGINQIPVRPKRGLTFVSGLRSIVRQDPDIIMVGEIRDRETADIAIRSALTGHLVFSTLHTNDAPGAVTRLLDMGVEPFLIASSIQGVLGQRLVRRLCRTCRAPVRPEPALREQFEVESLPERIYEATGCEECRHTGYVGRMGIFELLTMSEELHDLILREDSSAQLKRAARRRMQTMLQDGWEKISEGATSVQEVLKATQVDSIEGI